MAETAIEQLKGALYAGAMNQLAEVKDQAEHTRTLISILKDWQGENEKQDEKTDKTNGKTPQTQ